MYRFRIIGKGSVAKHPLILNTSGGSVLEINSQWRTTFGIVGYKLRNRRYPIGYFHGIAFNASVLNNRPNEVIIAAIQIAYRYVAQISIVKLACAVAQRPRSTCCINNYLTGQLGGTLTTCLVETGTYTKRVILN